MAIEREIDLAKMRRVHIATGKEGKQEAKYRRTTQRIQDIVLAYDSTNTIKYLRSLAYAFDF